MPLNLTRVLKLAIRWPFLAFLELFLTLRSDQPRFLAAEAFKRDDPDGFKTIWSKVSAYLEKSKRPGPPIVPEHGDIAVLSALDDHLWKRYPVDGFEDAPPLQKHDGEEYWILRRPQEWTARFTAQAGHLQAHVAHHWICARRIRGIELVPRPAGVILEDEFRRRKGSGFSARTVEFADGVNPVITHPGPNTFACAALDDQETRWRSVERELESAAAGGAEFVVLPELTTSREILTRMLAWLETREEIPFLLLLPGTLHAETGSSGKVVNHAVLWDGDGCVRLEHEKILPFDYQPSPGGGSRTENLRSGSRIELLITPAGIVAIPICRDFCDEGTLVRSLWHEIGPAFLLVPSMGPDTTLSAHERRAAEVERAHGTSVVLAHQDVTPGRSAEERRRGFVRGPGLRDTNPPAEDLGGAALN